MFRYPGVRACRSWVRAIQSDELQFSTPAPEKAHQEAETCEHIGVVTGQPANTRSSTPETCAGLVHASDDPASERTPCPDVRDPVPSTSPVPNAASLSPAGREVRVTQTAADAAPIVEGVKLNSSLSLDGELAAHAFDLHADLTGDDSSTNECCTDTDAAVATSLTFSDLEDHPLHRMLGATDMAEGDDELFTADWLDVTISMLHPREPDLESAK